MYVPELLPIGRIQPGSEARIDALMHNEEWVSRYPPQIAGYWSSGWPYLEAGIKATNEPWNAGLALPLFHADIAERKVGSTSAAYAVVMHMWHVASTVACKQCQHMLAWALCGCIKQLLAHRFMVQLNN